MEQIYHYLWTIPIAWVLFKIKQFDDKQYVTREEVQTMISVKTDHLENEFAKLETKIDVMNEQLVSIGVMIARIDERMKKDV